MSSMQEVSDAIYNKHFPSYEEIGLKQQTIIYPEHQPEELMENPLP